jgi:uncharacterized membrane protein
MKRNLLRRWFRSTVDACLSRRELYRPLCLERLEDRIMLDAGLPPALVVGRTLSAYTTAAIQNNRETITYTVYNEQAAALTGVLLTDTLAPGETFVNPSQLPDQSGQKLAWSLPTIQGFDRASVTITLVLPTPFSAQLDAGAQAFATLDAGAVSNSTPAATLRQGSVDPSLLASTPDANTTDPYIQEEAAKLKYDPQQIFNFLESDVGYNSYLGSVRGARGTLWSSAGNALDVSSLGVVLMRASGIPAQYVSGTLSQGQAQQLILSMFPASSQTVGYIPAGTQTADPANDPQLLSETESHYWFQFDTGSGLTDADPLLAAVTPGGHVGQAFTASTGTFSEVADSLRAKTEVSLTAEIYSQASAAFGVGDGRSNTVVLDQTFNDVDLVGRPITVGNFVSSSATGFIFSAQANTYTPYIVLGDDALPDSQLPEAIIGTAYQEVLTNFPLGNQILTGLFLNVTESGPGVASQAFNRALVDRIGYAARQGMGPASSLSVNPLDPPIITPFDLTTLNILPGLQSPGAAQLAQQRANQEIASTSSETNPRQVTQTDALIAVARANLANFTVASDRETANLESGFSVVAYFDVPRITMFSSKIVTANAQSTISYAIDLVKDSVRTIASTGQNVQASLGFAFARGVFNSQLEGQVLPIGGQNLSAATIVQQSLNQGIRLVGINATNLALLQTFNLPAEAVARITANVQMGLTVIVPTQAITVNGSKTTAWYNYNPTTGEVIAQSQAGGNQGITEFQAAAIVFGLNAFIIGFGIGLGLYQTNPQVANVIAKNGTGPTIGFLAYFYPPTTFIAILAGVVVQVLLAFDPPTAPIMVNLDIPYPNTPSPTSTTKLVKEANETSGQIGGAVSASSVAASGNISASWSSSANSGFQALSLEAASANVRYAQGAVIGSGNVAFTSSINAPLAITGTNSFSVNGTGSLSFYGPAESSLGVGGDWDSYSAAVNGTASITLTTDSLTLNGQSLPAGTYTITTSSATLTGSGNTTSPNFSGSVSITATNGTINLGPGSGSVTVGGNPLDPTNGATLTGYTGSVTVAADGGNNLDIVTLNGNAANVLTVSAAPAMLTTDQNTPITFQANVNTSFADKYNLTATAPPGWTVTIDSTGKVTATPAPGLQSGTFPIQIIAQSTTNPDLVAQTTVNVTITPTLPGVTLAVNPDPIFTVPFNGAQLPTAFRANIQNLGPAADTYNLTFANVPTGFTLLNSGTSITVPAGQTGILGLYLQPDVGQPIPPPGTVLSFFVTATSTTDPTITQTQVVSFLVPIIDALMVTSNPVALSTTPGAAVTDVITITNVGNFPEFNIALAPTLSSGLTLTGLQTVLTLGVGQSATETITVTPDASTPLNSALQATITATFGASNSPQMLQLPVNVVVPGAQAIATAAVAAGQLGDPNLANRLNDLSTALTNLVQNPTSAVYSSQAQAGLKAVVGLLSADAFLSVLSPALTSDGAALTKAATASDVQAAVVKLGNDLTTLGTTLADEVAHGFTLSLPSNSAVILPFTSADFSLVLQNNGSQATTYDLSVAGLPFDVTAVFLQNNQTITNVTLQPGEVLSSGVNGITLQLTEIGGSLFPTGFTVTASAEGAPEITQDAPGTLTVRDAVVDVTEVDATPPYTQPGAPVDVTAKVLNSVNKQQQALASYTVTDPNGTVVFSSTPVALTLNVQTSLITVDLGNFQTTGLADGSYTINVTVADASGHPIPGATGQGSVLIGTPVSGSLTVSPTTLPAGNGTVTNTLQIDEKTPPVGALSVVGQVAVPSAGRRTGGVVQNGNLLYVGAADGIRVYDVTDPTAPKLISTVGMSASVLRIHGNELVGLQNNISSWIVSVYSLADPRNPLLLGSTPAIPYYNLSQQMVVTDTHVFVPVQADTFFIASSDIFQQGGDLISVDISNPAAPSMDGVLLNTHGTDNDGKDVVGGADLSGGDFNMWSAVQVDPTTLLVASTTVTGGDTQNGVGRINIVDISDPTHMAIVGHLDIPGTVQVTGLELVGNQLLVTASTGGYQQNFDPNTNYGLTGDVVLATVDATAPRSLQLLHTQVVNRTSRSDAVSQSRFASLGNGLYAFSNLGASTDKPELQVINAADPQNFGTGATVVPSDIADLTGSGNLIYTTSADGLIIYQIGVPPPVPVTAKVLVLKNTVVSGSFNIAPTQIITSDPNLDTLEWDLSLPGGGSQTFTWQSKVTGLQAGALQTIVYGATVSFTSQGTPGMVTLPPTMVTGAQILGLSPASQTVAPEASATYMVKVTNPTSSSDTFNLAVLGVPAGWVNLPASVTVAANSFVNETVTLTSAAFAALGDYGFTVTANDANGAQASVSGDLILAGQPPVTDPEAHGVVVTLTPVSATAGQGTAAVYTVQMTNTGSADDTFTLSDAGLPAGVTALFSQTTIDVPPGVSNFRDVTLTLTPVPGTAAGADPFTVTATSTSLALIHGGASGTLNVVNNGVSVSLNANSGPPGTTFQATITNTGTVTDTFDLSLGSPAGLVASLGVSKVTLAAGASQMVTVTTGSVNFAVKGALGLTVAAKSEGNPAVQGSATASLTIPASTGLTASFTPDTQTLAAPGMATFILNVNNTGNTEDAYTATIIGSNGPVTSTLMGLDGQPTQSIPVFRLPGLSTGAILLQASLAALGTGAVTVQVKSLGRGQTSDNTATVSTPPVINTQPPTITNLDLAGTTPYELAPFTLVINGTGFAQGATVVFGNSTFTPDAITPTQIAVTLTASDEGAFAVLVVNPGQAPVSGGTVAVQEEFIAGETRDNDRLFISEVLRDLLRHAPNLAEINYYAAQLNQGMTRIQVIRGIEFEPKFHEFFDLEINDAYERFFHRSAFNDATAFAAWVPYLEGGNGMPSHMLEQLEAALAGSFEYTQIDHPGDFLNGFFEDALGRPPSATDVQLSQGYAPQEIATAVFSGAEFRQQLLNAYYLRFLDHGFTSSAANSVDAMFPVGTGSADEIANILGEPNAHEFYNKTAG